MYEDIREETTTSEIKTVRELDHLKSILYIVRNMVVVSLISEYVLYNDIPNHPWSSVILYEKSTISLADTNFVRKTFNHA